MRPQRIHLIPNDWQHLEVELNHLTKWISSQETTPLSSPTFIGLTLTGLTAGRIPVVTTGGLIADSPYLLWDNEYGELHLKATTAIYFGEDSESLIYHNGYYMRIIDDASIHLDAPAIITAGTLSAGAITGTGLTLTGMTGVVKATAGILSGLASFDDVANGSSTTMRTNLNADLLDGQHGSYYASATGYVPYTGATTTLDLGTNNFITTGSVTGEDVFVGNELDVGDGNCVIGSDGDITGSEITGISYTIGADTITTLTNLASLSGLTFVSTSFVKMTAAGTFGLDTATYQPSDADLTTIAGLANDDGNFIVGSGSTWVAESGNTARTSLGLGTTNTPTFAGISATSLEQVAPKLVASNATGTLLNVPNLAVWIAGTSNRITVSDDGDGTVTLSSPQDIHTAATPVFGGLTVGSLGGIVKATAGVLSAITDNSTNWDTAYTDRLKWDGGATGLVAATGRASLDLEIGTDVQAYDAGLTDIAALAVTDGNIIVGDGSNWVAESGATARTSLGLGTGDSPTLTDLTLSTPSNIYSLSHNSFADYDAARHAIVAETTNRTINLDNTMSTAEIQAAIDAVGKFVLPGVTITFQFADGTYSLTATLDVGGFFGGGIVVVQGNISEATTLHTTQAVILDGTGFNGNVIYVHDNALTMTVRWLKLMPNNAAGYYRGARFLNCGFSNFHYNYVLGNGVGNGEGVNISYGIGAIAATYVSNVLYGAVCTTGVVYVVDVDDTGTPPAYGYYCTNGGKMGKRGAYPTGSTADELAQYGGTIS